MGATGIEEEEEEEEEEVSLYIINVCQTTIYAKDKIAYFPTEKAE
jgi:hypothetical protein